MGACPCAGAAGGPVRKEPRHPMWLLPLGSFLRMTGPPKPFQQMKSEGHLVRWTPGMGLVVFVSHQWVSHGHPDPDGSQLQELRQALLGVLAGQLRVGPDLESEVLGHSVPDLSSDLVGKLRNAYIWYDYWSIPQVARDPLGKDDLAERSMIDLAERDMTASHLDYMARTDLFIALCPTATHMDTGLQCSFSSWLQRGWCRFEMTAWALASDAANFVLVQSGSHACLKSPARWLSLPLGDAEFSVEADRQLVFRAAKSALETCLRGRVAAGDLAKHRYLQAVKADMLRGLDPEGDADPCQEPLEEEVLTFLECLGFSSLLEPCEAGLDPLHCAALLGRPRVLEAAVRVGADVNAGLAARMAELALSRGVTPLMLACEQGKLSAAKCLLRLRADLECHDELGFTALHHAAFRGSQLSICQEHCQVLELLLERSSNIEAASGLLAVRPLCAACAGSNVQPLELLLRHGASVHGGGMLGGPLHALALWGGGGSDFVDLLAKYGADVNSPVRPNSVGSRFLLTLGRLAASFGRETELQKVLGDLDGATPLLVSALRGREDLCDALLANRAKNSCRNARGHSALDVAKAGGFRRAVALLESARSFTTA